MTNMKKQEVRTDLYTQSEYAKLVGKAKSTICLQVKSGNFNTVKVNGTILIKVDKIHKNE